MMKDYITPVLASLPLFFGTFEKDVSKVEVKEETVIEYVEEVVEEATLVTRASFYTSKCKGCTGYTKYKSIDVRDTIYINGMRVIAVDPNYIELGTIFDVELEDGETFRAIAADIGGAIKDNRIDILVSNEEYAFQKGRQIAYMKEVKE